VIRSELRALGGLMVLATLAAGSLELGGCASGPRFHEGPSALAVNERSTLVAAPVKEDPAEFRRCWRRPALRVGLLKWAEDKAEAVVAAPAGLLQAIRDEVGRLNQGARPGEEAYVTVTVFHWERGFFSRKATASYEVVGRDRAGRLLWVADDRLTASREEATSLLEGDEAVVARRVAGKLQRELGL
jgi:hypothetical protein